MEPWKCASKWILASNYQFYSVLYITLIYHKICKIFLPAFHDLLIAVGSTGFNLFLNVLRASLHQPSFDKIVWVALIEKLNENLSSFWRNVNSLSECLRMKSKLSFSQNLLTILLIWWRHKFSDWIIWSATGIQWDQFWFIGCSYWRNCWLSELLDWGQGDQSYRNWISYSLGHWSHHFRWSYSVGWTWTIDNLKIIIILC